MRKIRNILAGGLIAGALAVGAVAAPAAQAAAAPAGASAGAAAAAKGFTYYSGYDKGKRSLFKGAWFKRGGWYYVKGDLFDGDFDREYSYLWIRYEDRFGRFHTKRYKTLKRFHFEKRFFKVRHFWVGVSEGRDFRDDFSGFKRLW